MDIVQISRYLIDRIKELFGDIDYTVDSGYCKYEGTYRRIEFSIPEKHVLKISLLIYGQNNICLFTSIDGISCFHSETIERIESRLQQLKSSLS